MKKSTDDEIQKLAEDIYYKANVYPTWFIGEIAAAIKIQRERATQAGTGAPAAMGVGGGHLQ